MADALYLIVVCLFFVGIFLIVRYGLLLLGRMLHAWLIAKYRLFWVGSYVVYFGSMVFPDHNA